MKRIILSLIFVLTIKADLLDMVPGVSQVKNAGTLITFTGSQEEKSRRLEELKKERADFDSNTDLIDALQSQHDKVAKQIAALKEQLDKKENENFNRDLLALANEASQVLIDSQLVRRKILGSLDSQIAALENYLKDPNFKSLTVDRKAAYKFENLEKVSSLISTQEDNKAHLAEEKSNLELDLDNKKKALDDVEKNLKAKEKEQKEFSDKVGANDADIRNKAERLDYNLQLLKAKKDYYNLNIAELNNHLSLLDINLYITNGKLRVLREDLDTIDKSLWVNEGDIEEAEKALSLKKQKYAESQAKFSTEIKSLIQKRERLKDSFKLLLGKTEFPASDLPLLNEWSMDSSKYASIVDLYELGEQNDKILRFDQEITLKEASRDLEKVKLGADEILTSIISSWYKISQRKIKTEEDIAVEREPYVNYKNGASRDLTSFKDKSNSESSRLNKLAKVVNNLKDKASSLDAQQDSFVKKYGRDSYKKTLATLKRSESLVNKQIELTNKLIEAYTAITSTINDALKQTKVIVSKLDSIGGLLHRSEHAISWASLKNIIPDLRQFALDLQNMIYSFFSQAKLQSYYHRTIEVLTTVKSFFKLTLFLIFIFGLFFLIQALLPFVINLTVVKSGLAAGHTAFAFLALALGFVTARLKSLYFWIIFLLLIEASVITDLGVRVVFYLFSIPYLIILVNSFVSYLIEFNKKHKYVLLSKFFEHRFTTVLWMFLSSTVAIFFFRDAFMALTYSRSELPTLLLAFYSIIFRALLIFLIGKDELLEIIPKEKSWSWLRDVISAYYYPILVSIVALMVISDPYIGGFSKLVSFVLWSTIWSTVLIVVLWWGQIFVRKYSAYVFFSSEGEMDGAKERFPYAKTLYGLFMVIAFLFSIFIGIFLGAQIWGYAVGLDRFQDIWGYSFFIDKSPVTIGSIIKLFGFIFLGFVFSWAINRFILQKIFDILLIDVGVQNTVSSISRYIIIISVFLMGLLQVKLGSLIPVLVGAIVLGLAFAVKGPVNDFVAYFIILVERPIKLGDFVKVNTDIMGVVRKITARSVIIRRRNSVTIVVPNSMITNSSFYNWNYTQGFFAFDDIMVSVPYSADPEKVKQILFDVLDSNPNVLKAPKSIIRLDEFADSGFIFRVRGFLSSINVINQWQIASDIRFEIVKALNINGIQIASPVRHIVMQASDATKK
jgi:small-conductance mechanosensitive channel